MKDELGGKVITTLVGLRRKTYSYLLDDGSENKKKDTKIVLKRKLKFENYKICLDNKKNCLQKN